MHSLCGQVAWNWILILSFTSCVTLGKLLCLSDALYEKDLHDPDNHDGVITQLEPDILECEVKWASGSITTNKLVEVMEFQLSYFKS